MRQTRFKLLLIIGLLLISEVQVVAADSIQTDHAPRNEIYLRAFRPYNLLGDSKLGTINLDFSHKISKKYIYFTLGYSTTIDRIKNYNPNLTTGVIKHLFYTTTMFRINTKLNWLTFEFDAGIVFGIMSESSLSGSNLYEYNSFFYGIGPTISGEIQFNIGNWGNISLKTDFNSLFGNNTNSIFTTTAPISLLSKSSSYYAQGHLNFLYFGFNYYIGR